MCSQSKPHMFANHTCSFPPFEVQLGIVQPCSFLWIVYNYISHSCVHQLFSVISCDIIWIFTACAVAVALVVWKQYSLPAVTWTAVFFQRNPLSKLARVPLCAAGPGVSSKWSLAREGLPVVWLRPSRPPIRWTRAWSPCLKCCHRSAETHACCVCQSSGLSSLLGARQHLSVKPPPPCSTRGHFNLNFVSICWQRHGEW